MRAVWLPFVVVLGGCPKQLPDLEKLKPEVAFRNFQVKEATFQGLDTTFAFDVKNPLPIGIDVSNVSWKLQVSGVDFLDGEKGAPVKVDAATTSVVRFPVGVDFADLYGVVTESRGKDELPWRITGAFTLDTPAGALRLPFDHEGVLPALHPPKVKVESLKIAKVDLLKQTATLDLGLNVENRGGAALTFDAFDYRIALGGANVASGKARITPVASATSVELPIQLNLLEVGKVIVDAVTKKGPIDVGLVADAVVATPVGPVPLKLNEATRLTIK